MNHAINERQYVRLASNNDFRQSHQPDRIQPDSAGEILALNIQRLEPWRRNRICYTTEVTLDGVGIDNKHHQQPILAFGARAK